MTNTCKGFTRNGKRCKNRTKFNLCWRHRRENSDGLDDLQEKQLYKEAITKNPRTKTFRINREFDISEFVDKMNEVTIAIYTPLFEELKKNGFVGTEIDEAMKSKGFRLIGRKEVKKTLSKMMWNAWGFFKRKEIEYKL